MDGNTSSTKQKVELLQSKLEHARKENESLRLMVEIMNDKCNILQSHIQETVRKEQVNNKYLGLVGSYHESDHMRGPRADVPVSRTSKIYVKTHLDDKSLVVKDGYQWRKYGQKVTKDNPSPRAYFRCSMAPQCPVKKKVQRWMQDKRYLVATYDGEHNHDVECSQLGQSFALAGSSMAAGFPSPGSSNTFQSNLALDLTLSGYSEEKNRPSLNSMQDYHNKKMKIQEYVASLTKDPDFTIAIAAAVASSINDLPKPTNLFSIGQWLNKLFGEKHLAAWHDGKHEKHPLSDLAAWHDGKHEKYPLSGERFEPNTPQHSSSSNNFKFHPL